jgi:hypothetical protein
LPSAARDEEWSDIKAIMDYRVMQRVAQLLEGDHREEIEESAALKFWADVLNFGLETAVAMQRARGRN